MTERLPLNALQAFEVAARSGSFAAAAIDLGVSAAAVGAAAAPLPLPYVMIGRPAPRRRPGVEPVWQHLLARAGSGRAGKAPAG